MRVKPAAGFPQYCVADDGRVFGIDGRELRQYPNENGYLRVYLYNDSGRSRVVSVHSLVASTFIGPRPTGFEVRHLDGDKKNNDASNLQWGTTAENMDDRRRHRSSRSANATKLTPEKVVEAIVLLAAGKSKQYVARYLGTRQSTISLSVNKFKARFGRAADGKAGDGALKLN